MAEKLLACGSAKYGNVRHLPYKNVARRFSAWRGALLPLERLSMTFTANDTNETFAVCLQLSVQ